MIAVIADDFTGAAEIGGIAVRLGLKVVINTKVAPEPGTDVLIIATNTRSKKPEEARAEIRQTTSELLLLQPQLIYKKIDSVLRGNVGAELLEQIAVSGKKRALLIPANPSLKRIIQDGIYYFEGAPLHRSRFSTNSRDKVRSSNVVDLIGNGHAEDTDVISRGESFSPKALIIGNAVNEEDLEHWAGRLDEDTILAGGSSFFHALLRHLKPKSDCQKHQLCLGQRILYVCGSAFQGSRSMVANAFDSGKKVAYMPEEMFFVEDRTGLMNAWKETIISGFENNDSVIIAVDHIKSADAGNLGTFISEVIAEVVQDTLQRMSIDELVIEGGETASVIMNKLNYSKFYPVQELSPGVIRMKIEENERLHLTLKPGSYVWPSSIWRY